MTMIIITQRHGIRQSDEESVRMIYAVPLFNLIESNMVWDQIKRGITTEVIFELKCGLNLKERLVD